MVKICPTCKKFVPETAQKCPMCGNTKLLLANVPASSPVASTVAKTASKPKKKKSKVPVILICIVCLAISVFLGIKYISDNVLFGMDKCAYELLLEASYQFKNPSSVRIVSGSFEEDLYSHGLEWLFVRISATNGFGASISGYYMIWNDSDGEFHVDDIEEQWELSEKLGIEDELSPLQISYCNVTDQLNINAINRKLDKYWK